MRLIIALSFALMFYPLNGQSKDIKTDLLENQKMIVHYSEYFGISPRTVASIIYAERSMNYDWKDVLLDEMMALNRLDSSIGFCQIKMNTALWIESNLNDCESLYYLGDKIASLFPKTEYLDKLVEKLQDSDQNIKYAVAYLAMFKMRWQKSGHDIRNRPDILGTLYSLGSNKINGEDRVPHAKPISNSFGMVAKGFYDSESLLNQYPK